MGESIQLDAGAETRSLGPRLDQGNFSWGSEAISRKTRIIDVVYNAVTTSWYEPRPWSKTPSLSLTQHLSVSGMNPTTLYPWVVRRELSCLKPRRRCSTRRGPTRPTRSTRRDRRKPRSSRHSRTSSSLVVCWLPFLQDQDSAGAQMDTFLRARSWSSTCVRSRPRRENKLICNHRSSSIPVTTNALD